MTLQQLLDDNKITQAWLAKSLSISPPAMNSIVKHGVKTLNGRLWLNSEPGQGTEIIMEFPKHHMEKEAAE